MQGRDLILGAVVILLGAGCKSAEKNEAKDEGGAPASGAAKTGDGDGKASCGGVLMTRRVTAGESTLKLTHGGVDVPIALDVAADYPKNPMWTDGAPAACGIVETDGSLTLVLQLHDGGTPVFRFQATGLDGGGTVGDDVSIVAMLREGDGKLTLSLDKGTLKMTPPAPAPGPITLELSDVTGMSFGKGGGKPVTLSGALTVDVAAR